MAVVRAHRIAPGIVLALALCAWCGWASSLHRSTTPALAMWAASLAFVVAIDVLLWRGRHHRRLAVHLPPVEMHWPRPNGHGRTTALGGVSPWLALVLVVVVWEVLGIQTGPHEPHLTISALAQAFRPVAAALLLVWMLVGLGYGAARARAPVDWKSVTPSPGASQHASSTSAAVGAHPALMPALVLPSSRAVGVAFWVGLVVVCVLVDLAARRSRGRLANAEEFVRLISRPTVANILLAVAWTYAGWHLFAF
jgi:hypothetical protein